jgi:hypothetical protein
MPRDRTWLLAALIYTTGNGTSFAGPAPIDHFEQLAHRAAQIASSNIYSTATGSSSSWTARVWSSARLLSAD